MLIAKMLRLGMLLIVIAFYNIPFVTGQISIKAQGCGDIIYTRDTAICIGSSVVLEGKGYQQYQWTPFLGLSNPNIAKPIASPTMTTTYVVNAIFEGPNLIDNGDFEQGNVGFSSGYHYNPINIGVNGDYAITDNVINVHPLAAPCVDNTSGNGLLMAINGGPVPNTVVWQQEVSVMPQTDYKFSAWVTNWSSIQSNLAKLQFSVNGQLLGSVFQTLPQQCSWKEFFIIWNSGSAITADIRLVNQNLAVIGNDFGLDDLEFKQVCQNTDTVTVHVQNCIPILQFDLDACESVMANGSEMDYTEFAPSYPTLLSCADVSTNYLFRYPPQENKHSCTPGINNSPAMCVTTLNSCEYFPGNDASVVIEFSINLAVDSMVQFTRLEFYEKAPITYQWINGPSGPNNYPLYYGVRILKNGTEIYLKKNVQTSPSWTLQSYDFLNEDLFTIDENTNFRIELLSYCPVGNGANVSAWDIDEIKIFGRCVPDQNSISSIKGKVLTKNGQAVSGVEMQLSENPLFISFDKKATDSAGLYSFDQLMLGRSCFIKGYKNDDVLYGVSTLDILQMQKHLLGITPFTSIYQYIASDINQSGSVNVLDLLDLRKVLLGIYSTFPRNTSWRFGPLAQDMNGFDLSSFQEIKNLEYIKKDTQEVDFIGIKVGDVNGDIQFNPFGSKVNLRNEKELTLCVEGEKIKENIPFTINVKMCDHAAFSGIQMAFNFKNLSLVCIEGQRIQITNENYSLTPDGKFRLSWNQPELIEMSHDEVLFSITFVSHHSGFLSDMIQLDAELLSPEAYSDNSTVYRLRFEIGHPIQSLTTGSTAPQISTTKILSCSADSRIGTNDYFSNLSIHPNPTKGLINVSMLMEREVSADLIITDMMGTPVMKMKHRDGNINSTIDLSQYPDGLYLLIIQKAQDLIVQRIIKSY